MAWTSTTRTATAGEVRASGGSVPPPRAPIVQVTDTGTAVTVPDSPGTDAVADRAPQVAASSHSHVRRETSCALPAGGLSRICGTVSGRNRYASRAKTMGATTGRLFASQPMPAVPSEQSHLAHCPEPGAWPAGGGTSAQMLLNGSGVLACVTVHEQVLPPAPDALTPVPPAVLTPMPTPVGCSIGSASASAGAGPRASIATPATRTTATLCIVPAPLR